MSSSFDTSEIRKAAKRLSAFSKKNTRELMQTAAKGFVKDIVKYTPPASKGSTGMAAKKAGEAAIDVDTSLTMEVMSDEALTALQEFHGGDRHAATQLRNKKGEVYLTDTNFIIRNTTAALAFHNKKRSKASGRPGAAAKGRSGGSRIRSRDAGAHNNHVGRGKADDIALVPKSVRDAVRKALKKNVGFLAAGWNAGARKLGVKLPAFISRHAGAPGDAYEDARPGRYVLTLENAVSFVEGVKGYDRRIQTVLNYQANKLNRQADYLLAKAARSSGL